MKKLPLAFSGCLLGLAGAGNLISDTLPELSHVFSVLGLGLWIIFLISHLFDWQNSTKELKKPPVLSGMATFPMAGMILSTYFTYNSKCASLSTSSMVVLIPIRYWTNYLFYNSIIDIKRKNLRYAILDCTLCWNCCCSSNLSCCRNHSNSLCNNSFWFYPYFLFIPTYL